jgi:MFS family permease
LRIPSNDRLVSKIDWPGVILLTVAMTAIVWGLSEGNAAGWSSAAIVSALTIGAVAAIAFFVWETKSLDALVPGRLMQSIQFRAGNLVCLLMFMSMMGTLIFMAQYFAITQQTSASGAGWRMMPWTVSLFVVAPIGGILAGRLGERLPAVTGLLLQSAALTWMSFLCSSASSYGAWVPPLMLAGVGISLAMPAVQSAVLGSVAPRDMGKASGIYNTMRQLGWACGAAAAVAVFSGSGSLATAQTLRNGYAAVLLLTAALSITGALLSLKLPSAVRANVRPAAAPAVSSPE